MPDFTKVLRSEIIRLANKEVRRALGPLTKQLKGLRKAVRDQSRQLSGQRKAVSRIVKDQRKISASLPQEEDNKPIRISPASIKRHRERLGLSQREMGLLLGVSTGSVVGWESGRSSPRGKNGQAFARLRKMGVREVKEQLEKIEGS